MLPAFAEHGLGCVFPERTGAAIGCFDAQRLDGVRRGLGSRGMGGSGGLIAEASGRFRRYFPGGSAFSRAGLKRLA
jgi:hypothetical protein